MIHHGDAIEVMSKLDAESVDAIVTDPPYNLTTDFGWGRFGPAGDRKPNPQVPGRGGFMGKVWDGTGIAFRRETWEAAYRVAKPSAYLLAFGGTRTVHRMTVALEDAGWIIRDMLVWAYLSGFPKSRASLKPSWEPIVLARKPGPLRELNIEGCRIPLREGEAEFIDSRVGTYADRDGPAAINVGERVPFDPAVGRWPANIVMTEPVLGDASRVFQIGDYPSFLVVPKADRSDREPVLGGLPEQDAVVASRMVDFSDPRMNRPQERKPRANVHPTVKPTELMRHLVRLVTPPGGLVLDCFAGSGSTLIAAEQEGFAWVGIEREREYVAIAEARLNGTQRGLGLAG